MFEMKSKCYNTKLTRPKYIILQRMSENYIRMFFLWESYLQTNILRCGKKIIQIHRHF